MKEENIINSMLNKMKTYQDEYNNITTQINEVVSSYTKQIDDLQKQRLALQDEGNKKIDKLEMQRAQISGKYQGLYEQYVEIAGGEPDFSKLDNATDNVEDVAESTIEDVPAKPVNKTTRKSATKSSKAVKAKKEDSTELSLDELEALKSISTNVDSNGNEIPDYLKEEYNK